MEGMLQETFLKLLNMSLTAGWLILAVVVIRFIFRNQMKGFRCVLWGLVALRLIFPFSIESITSLIPSAEVVPPEIIMDKTPAIESGIGVVDMVINPIIAGNFSPAPGDSVNPLQVVSFIAAIVWIVGLAGMMLYSFISYRLLRRKVSASMQLEENIYLCDNIDSPFILGVIKPRIYLPSEMEEGYRDSVVAHEKAHLKRHDHWWKPLGFLLLSIYWFHPLIWVAYVLLCRDIELACDERVIKDMENEDKKIYSKALLSCSVTHKMVMVCPLSFGEVGVKARIKSVLNYKKPAFWVMLAAIVIGVVVVIGFMTDPLSRNRYGEIFAATIEDEEGKEVFWNLVGGVGNKDTWYYCPAIRIDDVEEMKAFISQLDVYHELTQRTTVWGEEKAFLDFVEDYDDAFYEENSLVIAYLTDGSFAYDHFVNKITVESGIIDVEIKRQEEKPGTSMPQASGAWFMILPMEDAKLEGKELVVHWKGSPREDIVRETPQAVDCVANAFRLRGLLSESEKELLWKNAENKYTVSNSKNKHLTIQKFDNKYTFEEFLEAVPGVKKSENLEMMLRKYNTMFFQENSLFIVHMNVGSGAKDYFVNSVYTLEKTLRVEIAQVPDAEDAVETFDVTDWIFTIEMDKNEKQGCTSFDALYVGEKEPGTVTEDENAMVKLETENHLYRVGIATKKWEEIGILSSALNNYNNDTNMFYFNPVFMFNSREKLEGFEQRVGSTFSIRSNATPSFGELVDQYDDAFFREKALVFVIFYSSGGAFQYEVDGAYSDGQHFFVQIAEDSSIIYSTGDVTYWLATIEVDKKLIERCKTFDAEIFMDYELLQQ